MHQYGGLPVRVGAFPDATAYADETTLASIRNDAHGFVDARRRLHGRRFASHERGPATRDDRTRPGRTRGRRRAVTGSIAGEWVLSPTSTGWAVG